MYIIYIYIIYIYIYLYTQNRLYTLMAITTGRAHDVAYYVHLTSVRFGPSECLFVISKSFTPFLLFSIFSVSRCQLVLMILTENGLQIMN